MNKSRAGKQKIRTGIRVDERLAECICNAARASGKSVSAFVGEMLESCSSDSEFFSHNGVTRPLAMKSGIKSGRKGM